MLGKAGLMTDPIVDSIVTTPETFPFKTESVLAGASD